MIDVLHIKIKCDCKGIHRHYINNDIIKTQTKDSKFFQRVLLVERARVDQLFRTKASDEYIRGSYSVLNNLFKKI